jgi:hypothetical protein
LSAVETPVDGMTLFIPYKRKRGEGEVGDIDTDIGDKYMRIGHGCMAGQPRQACHTLAVWWFD